jgi:hypothetical protein
MVKVQIGPAEMPGGAIDERWIVDQIRNRRNAKQPVCARVLIDDSRVKFSLATPECGGGGAARRWTDLEKKIIEAWTSHGMDKAAFTPGNLISFLGALRRILNG